MMEGGCSSKFRLYSLLIFFAFVYGVISSKPSVAPDMKSFSHAVKEGHCVSGKEMDLLADREGPGVITEQWFTGGCFDEKTVITYYIDNEPNKTIQGNLFMMIANGHGVLNQDKSNDSKGNNYGIPWGTSKMGHITENGGIYLTMRIPYQTIRVTAKFTRSDAFWFIIRGVDNYPLIVGDLQLPKEARLKLYKQENVVVPPLSYITLAANPGKSAGLVYLLAFAGTSKNFQYLEGCFRWLADDNPVQYLSSGTEDMFLSAYYFSSGLFHTEQSGLSVKEAPGMISAYKFFADDPLIFNNNFGIVWRCGEILDNKCFADGVEEACSVFDDGSVKCSPTQPLNESTIMKNVNTPKPDPMNLASYVWVYEW